MLFSLEFHLTAKSFSLMRHLKYENYSLIILFLSLAIVLLIYPFFNFFPDSSVLLKSLLSIVLVAAVIATTHKPLDFVIASTLAFVALLTNWASLFNDTQVWITCNLAFNIAFIGYVIWIHLIKIMTTRSVTKNILYGAICIYMLIGLMMAFVYMLISFYIPHSFDMATSQSITTSASIMHNFFRYTYFSFVTLTTLGYGDIHPISPPAEAFAYMEAIAGQFYLTVLVARLIGLHVSKNKKY